MPLDVREFEAYGQRWRAIRQASGWHHHLLATGDAPPVGLLFVDDDGERRFLPLPAGEFPSKRRFPEIQPAELTAMLDRALHRG